MNRIKRMERLEAPLTEQWRKAWADFAEQFHNAFHSPYVAHMDAHKEQWTAELEAEHDQYIKAHGLTEHQAFWQTDLVERFFPDDPDNPDLSLWPASAIPKPPAEPPEARERLQGDFDSQEYPRSVFAASGLLTLEVLNIIRDVTA